MHAYVIKQRLNNTIFPNVSHSPWFYELFWFTKIGPPIHHSIDSLSAYVHFGMFKDAGTKII